MAQAPAQNRVSLQQLLHAPSSNKGRRIYTLRQDPHLSCASMAPYSPLRTAALGPVDTKQICYSVLTDSQKKPLKRNRNSTSPSGFEISPGSEATYSCNGVPWAACSNYPI